MKHLSGKSKTSILALVLTLTIAATLIILPTATGQYQYDYGVPPGTVYETKAFLNLRHNPIGFGQTVLVNAWISPPPFAALEIYYNYTFTFIRPNGEVADEFLIPETEEPGTIYFEYTPDELGDWNVTFTWPGDDGRTPSVHAPASTSEILVVQEEQIPTWPPSPLPTDGWNYPISPDNREWYKLSGPWYMSDYNSSFADWNMYSEGPDTAHILWKQPPLAGMGGLIGGPYGQIEDYSIPRGGTLTFNTIIAGRAYDSTGGNIYCYDIRTGEQLWVVEGSFTVAAIRSNQPVLYAFGGDYFRIYDALTGEMTLDVPGMSMFLWSDPYCYSAWNYTRYEYGGHLIKWDTSGSTSNFTNRIIYNVTWPFASMLTTHATIWNDGKDDYIISRECSYDYIPASSRPQVSATLVGLFAYNGTTGEMLYNKQIDSHQEGPEIGAAYGEYFYSTIPQRWECYDIITGNRLWYSEEAEYPWGDFWAYSNTAGYGMLYGLSYAGVYAFNITNGKIVWHWSAGDSGMETPYSTWPFGSRGAVLADGKLYAPSTEHSPTLYYRGTKMFCLDAFTGTELWNITGYWSEDAIAEGYLFASNAYDGNSYCFGRGPTETTVSLTKSQINKGEAVGITGTIMDMSPAQPGTPCVSKDYMTMWMENLHMQTPLEHGADVITAPGVPLKLIAQGSDGDVIDIGDVTAGCNGYFAYEWTPQDEGAYTVTAIFEGDESYYSSYNITTLLVGPPVSAGTETPPETEPPTTAPPTTEPPTTAPPTTEPPTTAPPTTEPPTTEPPTGAPFPTEIAIIAAVIAVAVIGIAAYWVLRKRK